MERLSGVIHACGEAVLSQTRGRGGQCSQRFEWEGHDGSGERDERSSPVSPAMRSPSDLVSYGNPHLLPSI
uniref:Uncharacterized protein n=1 Tax=Anguilla anguilla TaxID=7936 RepID=A0A0E9X546_ANGAN